MVSFAMLRPSLCALTGPATRRSCQRLAGSSRAAKHDLTGFHGPRRYHAGSSSATTSSSSSHSAPAPRRTTAAMLGLVRPPCTAVGIALILTLTSVGYCSRDGLRAMDEAGPATARRRPFFSFSDGETALGARSHPVRGSAAACDEGRVLGDYQCERLQAAPITASEFECA